MAALLASHRNLQWLLVKCRLELSWRQVRLVLMGLDNDHQVLVYQLQCGWQAL